MGRRRPLLLAICSALAAIVIIATPATHPALRRIAYALHLRKATPPLRTGSVFPALRVAKLDGSQLTLDPALHGTVIYNVFTTWCPSCRIEAPLFAQAARRGVAIVGIDQGEPAASIERFTQNFGITYPILIDPTSSTTSTLSARVIPETIVVRDGIVRYIAVGPVDPARLRREVLGV